MRVGAALEDDLGHHLPPHPALRCGDPSAGTKPPLARTCRLTALAFTATTTSPWSRYGAGRRLRRQRLYLGFRPVRICQREALAPVQFEDRAQVDTGLAGLHLDGEVTGVQGGGKTLRSRTVFRLWRISSSRRVRRQPRPCSAKVNGVRRFLGPRVTVNSVQPNSWLANRVQMVSITWSWKSRLGSQWSFAAWFRRRPIPPSDRNARNGESRPHSRSRWTRRRRAPPLQSCSRSRSHAAPSR